MSKHYRPFTLARAGELAALARIDALARRGISPVFQIPPRPWDFDLETYGKSIAEHVTPIPGKLADAWAGSTGYVDASLLDSEPPVDGRHPLVFVVEQAQSLDLPLLPLTEWAASDQQKAAVQSLHAKFGWGAGVRLPQSDWTSIDPTRLPALLATLRLQPEQVDIFVDFEGAEGAVIEVAIAAELDRLRSFGSFRSVTVGGDAFPVTAGVPRGTTEYPRTDWRIYLGAHAKILGDGQVTPDFFDHLILRPDTIDIGVDPRFMSISAALRYTTDAKWLFAKGALFKGPGGSGIGGAALVDPLIELTRHIEYGTPIRSQADDWIDAVASGTASPGNPGKWREWGTVRHVEVVLSQLATLS